MKSALIPNGIIGYIKGRPIYEIRGGSVPPVEPPPPGQPGDVPDLLGGDPNDEGGDPNDGGDPPPAGDIAAQISQAVAAAIAPIQQQFTSELDRRIGQLTNRQQQKQQQPGQQPATPPVSQGPSSADIREARAAYRDAFADAGLRLTPEERDFLTGGLSGQLAAQLSVDPDPDRAGTAVARASAETIKKMRKHYQDRTIAELQRRGAIDMSKLQTRTPNPSTGTATQAVADFQKGAQTAHALLAARGRTTEKAGQAG